MATTYLQLTNELLRESNEVVFTSSNFSSAIGIQQFAKDCVNRAYNDTDADYVGRGVTVITALEIKA